MKFYNAIIDFSDDYDNNSGPYLEFSDSILSRLLEKTKEKIKFHLPDMLGYNTEDDDYTYLNSITITEVELEKTDENLILLYQHEEPEDIKKNIIFKTDNIGKYFSYLKLHNKKLDQNNILVWALDDEEMTEDKQIEFIEYLIDHGANIQDDAPIQLAFRNQSKKVILQGYH